MRDLGKEKTRAMESGSQGEDPRQSLKTDKVSSFLILSSQNPAFELSLRVREGAEDEDE